MSTAPSPQSLVTQEPDKGFWWYVVRYRTHSAWLKQQLKVSKLEIFHEYKHKRIKRGTKVEIHEVPVLNGFIFVHAPFDLVNEFASSLNLHVMRDRFCEHAPQSTTDDTSKPSLQKMTAKEEDDAKGQKYLRIRHKAMLPFMKAVTLKADEIQFTEGREYDIEKHDLVRVIKGDMKGAQGYLIPGKGRNGGTIIVPLTQKEVAPTTSAYIQAEDAISAEDYKFPCYKFDVRQEDLIIIAFAKGNRHAKDCIIDIRSTANEAFEHFKSKDEINDATRKKLAAYVLRYGQARVNTSTQKAQHYALLYRIHAILGNRELCKEWREAIDNEVIPDLIRKRDAALKRNNAEAAAKHSALLEEIKATKAAIRERKGKASHRSSRRERK